MTSGIKASGAGRISTIPAMPKGATGNLQYGSGETYTITATFADGRSCSARFAYGTPADEVEAKWAKAVARIPKPAKPVPAEERNKPTTEPFLTEWLALHKQHLKALREGRKDPLRLCDAVKLADAKYDVYRREITAAAERTLRRLRKDVVRVTAGEECQVSAKFVAIVVDQWCGGDASAEVRELNATTIETAREEAERFIDGQGGTSALFVIQARCAGDGGVELAWEELDPGVILRKQDDARREREAKARAEAREAKLFQLRGEIAVLERLAAVQDDAACSEYARRESAGRRAVLAKLEAE